MAFDAFPSYLRSQAPSGRVPQQGAAQGAGAKASAQMELGRSMAGVGGAIADIGADMEAERLRQSSVNQVLALTDIERQHRTFLADMKRRSWTENGTGTWNQSVAEWNKTLKSLLERHAKSIHPSQRAAWQAAMDSRNLTWSNAVVAQAAELREDYANEALATQYVNRYAAGDVQGAQQLAQMAGQLFEDDELWQERLADAHEQIVWKVAQQGDIQRAYQLTLEIVPEERRATVASALERYEKYMEDMRARVGHEMQLQELSQADALVSEGKVDQAIAKVVSSPWIDQTKGDQERERFLNTGKEAVTTPRAFLDTLKAQLRASTGKLDPKTQTPLATPAQAREIAAVHRYDNRDLSADDLALIANLSASPSNNKIILDVLEDAMNRVGRSIYAPMERDVAEAMKVILEQAAKQQEAGQPLSKHDLDMQVRELTATRINETRATAMAEEAARRRQEPERNRRPGSGFGMRPRDYRAEAANSDRSDQSDATQADRPADDATGAQGKPRQMRMDTPEEVRDLIQKALDVGLTWDEIAQSDQVRPYVVEAE